MTNIAEIKEGYNPRIVFDININKEEHCDSQWLAGYWVEQLLINTTQEVPFVYSKERLERWLDTKYEQALFASRQDHYLNSGILPNGNRVRPFTNNAVCEFLFQKIVQNGLDAAFLSQVGTVGPCDLVESILQKIKHEEAGCGDAALNHCNCYIDLVDSLGYKIQNFERLAKDTRLIDASFADPAFQLSIARFPRRYKPEIIGMAMYLEWTGSPEALKIRKLLDGRGIDSSFYKMHVVADNIKNGHGHDIKIAIPLRSTEGQEAMQRHWQRIFQGYATWSWIIDDFERELVEYLVYFENELDVA
jgi:Iron-containing redox enzyme